MGSADWMPRNLDRRVEILFPVEDEKLKERLLHILDVQLNDNVKAHFLQPDGTYAKKDKRQNFLVISRKFSAGGGAPGCQSKGRDDGPGEKQGVYSIGTVEI